jgi:hypothetical protein
LRLAVLSLHVRADAVTREAATAAAADAAPAPAAEGIFLPPCSTTSPLPAAFCNIVHRFSKPISGDARASVNETCSKFQHGIAWFKSLLMRSADQGKTMSVRRALVHCYAIAVRVMLTCDVGQVEQGQRLPSRCRLPIACACVTPGRALPPPVQRSIFEHMRALYSLHMPFYRWQRLPLLHRCTVVTRCCMKFEFVLRFY